MCHERHVGVAAVWPDVIIDAGAHVAHRCTCALPRHGWCAHPEQLREREFGARVRRGVRMFCVCSGHGSGGVVTGVPRSPSVFVCAPAATPPSYRAAAALVLCGLVLCGLWQARTAIGLCVRVSLFNAIS